MRTLLGLHSLCHQLPSHCQVVVVVALEDQWALLMRDFCCLLLGLVADGFCKAEGEEGLIKLPVDRGAEVIVSTEVDGDPL